MEFIPKKKIISKVGHHIYDQYKHHQDEQKHQQQQQQQTPPPPQQQQQYSQPPPQTPTPQPQQQPMQQNQPPPPQQGSGNHGQPPPVNSSTKPGSSSNQQQQDPMAPRFLNISNHDVVYERMFLLHGTAGSVGHQFDASIVVYHHLNSFPAQRFPVTDGYFKALIHLESGPNQIRIEFEAPSLNIRPVSSSIVIHYSPLLQNPPLHLVYLLGKDSPGEFDSPKYKKDKEGNGIELAKKKIRMAGYMMQAFTDEQMYRNGFGHRTFRLYEEYAPDTISNRDSIRRTTVKVHVIRTDKTMAELRDPNKAQQNPDGKDKGALFSIALDTLKKEGGDYFGNNNGQDVHVACIFADTHWDPEKKIVLGHAALGGGANHIRLAIFGGHSLHAWPSCIEEIVPSFLDDTKTDTSVVANDANQSGTSWEALNIGQGAFMHEIGHLLGCPHQPHGVMLRGYVTWNRVFMPTEAKYCARTNKPGMRLALQKDEPEWHRFDTLRFRFHSSFRMPWEYPMPMEVTKPNLYPVDGGVFARSATGIYLVEIHVDGGAKAHLEYVERPQTEMFLIEDDLRQQLPEKNRGKDKEMKLMILACGEQQAEVKNFAELANDRAQIPGGGAAFKSNKLGGGSGNEMVTAFPSNSPPLRSVKIHHGRAIDGVEFVFGDGSKQVFGKAKDKPTELNLEPGEELLGFYVRTGAWLDGIQVVTNRRRSEIFGKKDGGKGHDLIAPHGFKVVGLYGNVQNWVMSIGLLYNR